MDMQGVVKLFGTKADLARAARVTPQAINNWQDPLTASNHDRAIAACVRRGIDPAPLLESERTEDGYQIKSGMTGSGVGFIPVKKECLS